MYLRIMANRSIAQFRKKLNDIASEVNNQKLYVGAASAVGREVAKRIFQDGISSDGGPITPAYSTKPIYVGADASPRASAAGKYQGGYGQFKRAIGRGGNVNLFLFGFFNRAYLASVINPTVRTTAQGINIGIGINYSTQNPREKVDGLLSRYEDAFKYSQSERELAIEKNREVFRKLWR